MKRLIYLLSMFFLWGCGTDKAPAGVVDSTKMVLLLVDIHIADGYLSSKQVSDSMKQVASNYYNSIYRKHGIDSTTYNRSLKYYAERPELMSAIYEKVQGRMNKIEKQQQTIQDTITAREDRKATMTVQ